MGWRRLRALAMLVLCLVLTGASGRVLAAPVYSAPQADQAPDPRIPSLPPAPQFQPTPQEHDETCGLRLPATVPHHAASLLAHRLHGFCDRHAPDFLLAVMSAETFEQATAAPATRPAPIFEPIPMLPTPKAVVAIAAGLLAMGLQRYFRDLRGGRK